MSNEPKAMSRRVLLATALVALGAAPALAAKRRPHAPAVEPTFTKGVTKFRSVEIDTRPLIDRGLPHLAERIRDLGGPVARAVFADRLDPHAPEGLRVLLRIKSIDLREPMTGRISRFDSPAGGDNQDWIEGTGVVLDNSGHVFASVPITTSASSNSAGPRWSQEGEVIRTRGLVELLARWVKQDI